MKKENPQVSAGGLMMAAIFGIIFLFLYLLIYSGYTEFVLRNVREDVKIGYYRIEPKCKSRNSSTSSYHICDSDIDNLDTTQDEKDSLKLLKLSSPVSLAGTLILILLFGYLYSCDFGGDRKDNKQSSEIKK